MTVRRTPRQRAGQRGADEAGRPAGDFRDIARRRQDAEEKLRKHLEGERDGRPVDDPHELVDTLDPGGHARVMRPPAAGPAEKTDGSRNSPGAAGPGSAEADGTETTGGPGDAERTGHEDAEGTGATGGPTASGTSGLRDG